MESAKTVTPQRLGQTELLETPPSRKLIVPSGHRSWWGIDPSTKRCAIGTVSPGVASNDDLRKSQLVSFPTLEGGRRLAVIANLVRDLASALALLSPPGLVVVEQPSGKSPNLELVYATGVIMGAVSQGITATTGHVIRVETVPPATWKRVAVGRGDIYKPSPTELREGAIYPVLAWAQTLGYTGSSWDEADAWGIADYARRTVALEKR